MAGAAVAVQAQDKTPTPPGPTPAPKGSGADKAITVTVPDDGEHFIRPVPSPEAKQQAHLPQGPFKDKKFTVSIDTTGLGKSPKLAIDNAQTGNTAIVPFPSSGAVEVSKLAFEYVHRVEVTVTYDGKPVQVAQITMTPESGSPVTRTIDAAARGMAVFEDVKSGKAKLNVVYGDKLTNTQDIVVSTDHTGDKLAIQAPVSNKVPTIDVPVAAPTVGTQTGAQSGAPSPSAGAPTGPAGSAGAPEPQQTGGGIPGLLGQFLGLAIICGILYALYRWAQSGGMAATLKKVGVEVSGPTPPSDAGTPWQPNAPAAPVVTDPSLCQFCGQRKDAAGNCLCAVGAGAVGPGAGAGAAGNGAAVPSQPRLVGTMGVYSGSIFPVTANGSPMTFGRDAANSVSLADDTTVSRRHASLRSENGGFVVADEGSSNGIYVNGVRVSGSQPIRPGDEVQIGNTRFRFEL
jgi:hypothetical protein